MAVIVGAVAWFGLGQMASPDLDYPGPPLRGADLNEYFVPSMEFVHSALHRGEFPLWNPFQMAGVPFFALHSPQALYPPLLALAWLSPEIAITWHVLVHLALIGLFTFLFLRRLGASSAGSVTAALAFMFSSPVVTSVHNLAYLATYAWLPATLYATKRLIERPSFSEALGVAVAATMALLAGYSQGFLYIAQAGGLYALFELVVCSPMGGRLKAFKFLLVAAAFSLGMMAIQLFPTVELASEASRNLDGLTMEQVNAYGQRYVREDVVQRVMSGEHYPGFGIALLFAPLAALAVFGPGGRLRAIFFLVLVGVVFDLMLGDAGSIFPLYYQLPLGNVFRILARASFVYQFGAAVLMGLGVSAVGRLLRGYPTVATVVTLALMAAVGSDVYSRNPLKYRFDPIDRPGAAYEPHEVADLARTVGHQRIFVQRFVKGEVARKFGMLHGVYVVPDYEPLLPGLYTKLFGIPDGQIWHGQADALLRAPKQVWRYQDPRLWDLLSVRLYVNAVPNTRGRVPPKYLPGVQGRLVMPQPVPVYDRGRALPRAYVVGSVRAVATDEEAIEMVRTLRFDPWAEAIVVGPVEDLGPKRKGGTGTATIESMQLNSVRIDAECQKACLLVLTDLDYPGWGVTVDGSSAEIIRTNGIFRGVRLEPGRHRVEYFYRPLSLILGATITGLTILAAALLVLFARRPTTESAAESPRIALQD